MCVCVCVRAGAAASRFKCVECGGGAACVCAARVGKRLAHRRLAVVNKVAW